MVRYRIGVQSFERLGERGCEWIYPALKRVPRAQRSQVLRAARDTELDGAERFGMVGSVGVVAYLLQSSFDDASGLFAGALVQFVLAWPLLAVLVAPWLVRRTRRGLQREVDRFDGGDPCPEPQAAANASGLRAGCAPPRSREP